jgi:hypothetical protein
VDDYLWFKNKAEKRQEKMDRIDEQKMMRLRDRRERDERTGAVQKLLMASHQERGAELQKQKDSQGEQKQNDGEGELGEEGCEAGAAAGGGAAEYEAALADREVWEETPDVDYEAFEEALAAEDTARGGEHETEAAPPPPAWTPPGAATEVSLTAIPRDASLRPVEPRKYFAPFVPGMEPGLNQEPQQKPDPNQEPQLEPGLNQETQSKTAAPVTAAAGGWDDIDAVVTVDPRTLHKSAAPDPAAGMPVPGPDTRGSMFAVLEELGLSSAWDAFVAAGETDAHAMAALGSEAGPRLASLGLKLGQRQRVITALARM